MSLDPELIGLHPLVGRDGRLAPQLVGSRRQVAATPINVILFPAWEARMPGEAPLWSFDPVTDGGNVFMFPSGEPVARLAAQVDGTGSGTDKFGSKA